jgi:eukaryotic-like serine/threonine-protein kinase
VTRHECVLQYHDHWTDSDGRLHIVTEYAAGGDLIEHAHRLQREHRWSVAAALPPMVDAALGLAHVHGKGMWHRDIKPSNVLVSGGGRALLADFGLAREAAGGMLLTSRGHGTGVYLPPERFAAHLGGVSRYDGAADVWALGCTLHGLLLGLPPPFAVDDKGRAERESAAWSPFWREADGGASLVANLVTANADLSRLPADTPPDLLALLGEMLAKDPAARPDAAEVAARLVLIVKALTRRAGAAAAAGGAGGPAAAAVATVGLGAGAGAGGAVTAPRPHPPPPAAPLPPGWRVLTDPDSGRPYFWHEGSGVVLWERPG